MQLRPRLQSPPFIRDDGEVDKNAPSSRIRRGKTMSMVLLDIDPDEKLGPRYVAPFSSDVDECEDPDDDDGNEQPDDRRDKDDDDVVRERMRGVGTTPSSSASNDRDDGRSFSMSTDDGPRDDGAYVAIAASGTGDDGGVVTIGEARGDGNDATMMAEDPNAESWSSSSSSSSIAPPPPLLCNNSLKCQGYTNTHLEALHMHRDAAGRDDKRCANSTIDAPLAIVAPTKDRQRETTPDALDGSIREPSSARSTDTFVISIEGECETNLDIVMPSLSYAEVHGADAPFLRPQDPMTVKKNSMRDQTSTKHAHDSSGDVVDSIEGGRTMKQSSSCSSDMTIKAGNIHLPPSRGILGASFSTASSCINGRYRPRSASCSTSVGTSSSSVKEFTAACDLPSTTATLTRKQYAMDKLKSPDKHHPLQDPIASTPAQTMKEYVMNDLLNIDSRNQDGSATEDIDENMEEFLRVPPKLEGLMLFSLAVCIDSFLYVWAMLPLKFVWGLVSLACSIYSPKKGIKGVKFHRR
jgi:hypothetical protein